MPDTPIGSISIDLALRIAGYKEGTQEVSATTQRMSRQAQRDINAITKATDPLQYEMETMAKRVVNLNTVYSKMGDQGSVAAQKVQRAISAANDELEQLVKLQSGNGKQGISAGQLANANRMLPAQFTDIATQLQGGQSPLTILFQQGGQIRDMYGGVGTALKAVGSAIIGMINPITLTAGAIAGVGYALYESEQYAAQFNKTLITTGQYSSSLVDQLTNMRSAVAQATNDSGSNIGNIMNTLVASGTISLNQLQSVTETVAEYTDRLGLKVADVAKIYTAIGDDPVKGLLKLSDATGQVTEATMKHVIALEKQHNDQEAVTSAIAEANRILNLQSSQATQTAGWIQKSWNGIAEMFEGVAHSIEDVFHALNTLGLAKSSGQEISDLQTRIKNRGGEITQYQSQDRYGNLSGNDREHYNELLKEQAVDQSRLKVLEAQTKAQQQQTEAARQTRLENIKANDDAVKAYEHPAHIKKQKTKTSSYVPGFAATQEGFNIATWFTKQSNQYAAQVIKERQTLLEKYGNSVDTQAAKIKAAFAEIDMNASMRGGLSPQEAATMKASMLNYNSSSVPGLDQNSDDKYSQQEKQLQSWYDTQLQMLDAYHSSARASEAIYQADLEKLQADHAKAQLNIRNAQFAEQSRMLSNAFGGDADLMAVMFGKQSAMYKAAFGVSKAYAMASAEVSAYSAAAKAYDAMAGIPFVGPVLGAVAAAGAYTAIMANAMGINGVGMAHSGIDSVPESGTWLLQKGERVTTSKTSAKLDRTLSDIQQNQANKQSQSSGDIYIMNGSQARRHRMSNGELATIIDDDFNSGGPISGVMLNRMKSGRRLG